jgi:hypothetical protein
MVERMLSMHEAQGSIPWFSTLLNFFSLPPSVTDKTKAALQENPRSNLSRKP